MNMPFRSRQFATCLAAVQPVPFVRLPNQDWIRFLDGDLTADDWALIERVEAGEITVDAAMAGRGL